MAYSHAEIIWELLSPDGKVSVELLRRHDGLYQFVRSVQRIEKGGPFDGEAYWSAGEPSGLYETREEAERDALDTANWLRQQNPN